MKHSINSRPDSDGHGAKSVKGWVGERESKTPDLEPADSAASAQALEDVRVHAGTENKDDDEDDDSDFGWHKRSIVCQRCLLRQRVCKYKIRQRKRENPACNACRKAHTNCVPSGTPLSHYTPLRSSKLTKSVNTHVSYKAKSRARTPTVNRFTAKGSLLRPGTQSSAGGRRAGRHDMRDVTYLIEASSSSNGMESPLRKKIIDELRAKLAEEFKALEERTIAFLAGEFKAHEERVMEKVKTFLSQFDVEE